MTFVVIADHAGYNGVEYVKGDMVKTSAGDDLTRFKGKFAYVPEEQLPVKTPSNLAAVANRDGTYDVINTATKVKVNTAPMTKEQALDMSEGLVYANNVGPLLPPKEEAPAPEPEPEAAPEETPATNEDEEKKAPNRQSAMAKKLLARKKKNRG